MLQRRKSQKYWSASRTAAMYLAFANVEVADKYIDMTLILNPENSHTLVN
jgi:hypothetical protein